MFSIKKILSALLLLSACSPVKKDKQLPAENILVFFGKIAAAKGYDTAFLMADQQLEQLNGQPDSLKSFINYSVALYDTANSLKNYQKAKAYLQNIINHHEKVLVDSPALLAKAYYYWAETYYRRISPFKYNDTALRYFEKAISLNLLDTSDTRYANKCLGIYYNMLGDLKKTMLYYDRERYLLNSSSTGRTIIGNAINRSIALREMGYTDEAILSAEEAVACKNVTANRTANAWTELSASQLAKGLTKDAMKSVMNALYILDTISVNTTPIDEILFRKGKALRQKGEIQRIEKKYKDAAATIFEAISKYQETKSEELESREIGKTCIELGNIFIQLDMPDSALFYFHQALTKVIPSLPVDITSFPATTSLYKENTIMEAFDAKAAVLEKIYATNKNPDLLTQAVNCYEFAFETKNKLMQSFSYDESLARQTRESKSRSEKAIAACYELYRLTGSATWTEKAFLLAEKSKGVVLQESIKRNLAANILLQQDSNWLQVQHFQQEVKYYETKLATTTIGDTASANLISRQLNAAENNLLMANTALLNSNSVYREALLKTDSLSEALVKNKLLDNNTALLEFFTGDSSTYLFLITKNSPPLFIKASDSLSNSINDFLEFFTDKNKINNEPGAYQAAAYRLYQQAGFPVIHTDVLKKLIIIPDGRLNFVPFDALVTGIKTAENPQLFSYLLHQKQISYGYSVATLLKQSDNQSTASSKGLIFFAPVFVNKERGKTPLLHTIEESDAIKNENSSGKFYLKERATIGEFKKSAAGAGIIHVASHASADTVGGLPPLIDFYDSSLYLNEIYTLDINPRLVILSACETGIGIIDKSEGAMSLARGFYYAGAQNIITSLWSVDDRSTAGIFTDFYGHLNNSNYSFSLHKAKRAYLTNASISSASPYYWAGFIHIGYQKQPGSNNRTAWIITALAAAILSLFMLRKRK